MESRRILIVQGHPDATSDHFCHALARSYREAAVGAGHEVRTLDVSGLDSPSCAASRSGSPGPSRLRSPSRSTRSPGPSTC